jgi:hypothetical protein
MNSFVLEIIVGALIFSSVLYVPWVYYWLTGAFMEF